MLALALVVLIPPSLASANFVYWTNAGPSSSVGRIKINGTGLNNSFIPGLTDPRGVAVDSNFIYWTQGGSSTGSIGRANLNGSSPNATFIPHSGVGDPDGIAVTPTAIYWTTTAGTIGRANIDGTNPSQNFITLPAESVGLAADSGFLYYVAPSSRIGRVPLGGGALQNDFISVPIPASIFSGPAVDPGFAYYGSDSGNTVGRGPISGGGATQNFIPAGTTHGGPIGVAVNPQYVFWGDDSADTIGRANINGSSPNHGLVNGAAISGPNDIPGADASQFAAAPSNKVTVNSTKKNKKKGTATINAKVSGPGQITLNQTSTPPDANATAAAVKTIGLTITQASSFNLAVKPTGKTAKKLNKQVKKQLRKKQKAKATAKVTTYIHFVPAGVAGVPNTLQVNVTLVKQAKKK